jgi:hypothetical protein
MEKEGLTGNFGGLIMKKKETVDDEAIKRASKTQRALKKDSFPEMEDQKEYKRQKQIKSAVAGKHGRRQKKEAREDRKKNELLRINIAKQTK